jgi:hypothetical protein
LLTLVVFAAATPLGLNLRPYVFAYARVANAASFLLPVSNPANLLIMARVPLKLECVPRASRVVRSAVADYIREIHASLHPSAEVRACSPAHIGSSHNEAGAHR